MQQIEKKKKQIHEIAERIRKFIGSSRISVESNYAMPYWFDKKQQQQQKQQPAMDTKGEKELITHRIYWIKLPQTNTFAVKFCKMVEGEERRERRQRENTNKINKQINKQSPLWNASINIVVIFVIFPIFNINYNRV